MAMNRRDFLLHSAAATTFGLGFSSRTLASSANNRNLVVLYLAGGNDALSFLVPYGDKAYYERRQTQAILGEHVHQIGTDREGSLLGLHPELSGLKSIYEAGHAAIIQRTGYDDASRSHFVGADILATADPHAPQGGGWLGAYLNTLDSPVDPLSAWNTQFQLPRALHGPIGVPSIRNPDAYAYFDPWGEKDAAKLLAGLNSAHPDLAFLNQTAASALHTIPRVATVLGYKPSVIYPPSNLGGTLQVVASAIASDIGSRVFWVQAGGYDTHASQGTLGGTYAELIGDLDRSLHAFYSDLKNQGLLEQTLILQYSEFGRRVDENGSQGTDHGAAGLMLAMGGSVQGGLHGTAARTLAATDDNPDLENGNRDVRHQHDFRSVYASILEDWLGVSAKDVLKGDYRNPSLRFL